MSDKWMSERELLAMVWGMIVSSVQDSGGVYLDKDQMNIMAPLIKNSLGLKPDFVIVDI